ncbi:MAG: tetratricopeptide repeat protein [Candidatus Zixiibacteriota bacterium]
MRSDQTSLPRSRTFLKVIASALPVFLCLFVAGCAGHAPKRAEGRSGAADTVDPNRARLAFYHYNEGTMLAAGGDQEGAARAFEQALQLDPGSYEIRLSLAETYFALRQLERAITVAQAARPQDKRALELLGRCYRFLGRQQEARQAYRQLVAIDSTDTDAWWMLSRLALRDGQIDEAVADLEQILQHQPDPRIANEIGDLHRRMGRDEQAAAAFRRSLELDTSTANLNAYGGLAASLESLGRSAEALAIHHRLVARAPDNLAMRKRLMHFFLGQGQSDSAAAVIQQILAISPNDPERLRLGILWYNTGQTAKAESLFVLLADSIHPYIPYYYIGRISENRNDYTKAKDYFRRATALGDSIPDAWLQWAYVLLDQDSVDAALATAHRGMAAVGAHRSFWHFLGIAFGRAGQHDSAVVWLRRAWDADTADTRVQFALAAAWERAHRFDSAAAMFQALIAREPQNATALNYLGYMYADSGVHLDESRDLIERALAIEPNNGAYLDSYGWVLYRQGHLKEAEIELRKALEVLQSDPTIHEHLGDILAALGRHEDALAAWRRALELDPTSESVKRKLGLTE